MHAIFVGLIATAAMSAAMRASQALGRLRRPPPGDITERALKLPSAAVQPATALANTTAHFAYGAALALPFAAVHRRLRFHTRLPLTGMAYGLAIWAANYQALLPALGLMPPAHRDDQSRVGTMIGAHLVYGAVLESLLARRS